MDLLYRHDRAVMGGMTECLPRLRPDPGRGDWRLTWGPSLDGGLEEFCED